MFDLSAVTYNLHIDATDVKPQNTLMCSQYTAKYETQTQRILPYRLGPVIVCDRGKRRTLPMSFSLVPSWSKEPKVKFATHNARIESITEKPTWKIPFQYQHCLVPMDGFFESVYEGPMAGNVIQFVPTHQKTLYAAGIFDYWKHPLDSAKNFFSYSVLTREPSNFILQHGHDRTPIFLNDTSAFDWLDLIKKDNEFIRSELLHNAVHPELKVEIDRPLKAGWEKRK